MEVALPGLRRNSSSSTALSSAGSVYRQGAMHRLGGAVAVYGRAPSVYGGAGGHNIRISTSRQVGSLGSSGGDLIAANEKMTMQNLNDRLANYLEKVRSLEQSNSHLELLIRQWYESNAPTSGRDYSAYYRQIEELQAQIKGVQLEKARIVLQIDNARLATDDFRLKFETERGFRLSVEADVQGLHKVRDDLTLSKADLEMQIEEMTKDLAILKKEHEEEVAALRRQLGNTVNVEMDAAPAKNLGAIMNEMRQKYEIMAQENLQKAKEQFEQQIASLQNEVTVSTEELKGNEIQIKEMRLTYQTVEIELQSYLSMKESLERTLEETKARYGNQLARIQGQLSFLESQLMKIRADAEHQTAEYNALLDIKTRLEQEILTYRRLLEGEEIDTGLQIAMLEEKDVKKTKKIKTVVEELVDGKVVSSEIKEIEENI